MEQGGRGPTVRGRTYGANIFACRKRLGLTQEQFGSRLGVTQATVNRWERGISIPDDDRKVDICGLCGMPFDMIFPRVVAR